MISSINVCQITDLSNLALKSTYSHYLGPIYERQKTQPWGVWSLPLLLISTQRVIAITLSCYQRRIWKRSVHDTFIILVCKNLDSFLRHLKNQKYSIHFIDVTNSNKTLTIHGTASLKQEPVVYKIPCE